MSWNDLSGAQLKETLAAIPHNVNQLDLSGNCLTRLSNTDIHQLKGSLLHLETIVLSHDEVTEMTKKQCLAWGAVFPAVKNVVFLDASGAKLRGNPRLIANLARTLGIKTDVPSLQLQGSFFVKNSKNIPQEHKNLLPDGIQDLMKTFTSANY